MRRLDPRYSAGAVALLALAGCASDPAPPLTAAATTVSASPCLLEQSPVVQADGTELYLEPQTLFRLGEEWLLVGSPSYEFEVAPGREAVHTSRYDYVAVSLGQPARAITKPIDGPVGSMIATPLADGGWAAIFDEVDTIQAAADSMGAAFYPTSYWYGEHDGTRWSLVEPLPVPSGTRLDLRQSSNLVLAGDRLIWIAFDDDRRAMPLHRYERIGGVWRHEQLPDEWVELTVLAVDQESRLWMLLTGAATEFPNWPKSIRLYRDGQPPELVSRVAVVSDSVGIIYHTSVELGPNGAVVSWAVASQDGFRALTRTGIRPGSTPDSIVELDDHVEYVYSMTMPDGSLAWVVEHVDRETGREELRLLRLDGTRVVRVATAPSPFTGFFRSQPAGPNEVLLVGPQMGRVPTETPVRSLILRLSTSC